MHLKGTPPIISVNNLSFRYSGSSELALQDLDLTIPGGQCFGLLGPNGAGKTTLLSILTGMVATQSGHVTVNGMCLSRSHDIKRISAIVPQDLAFYPGLTGRENLECFAGFHGLSGAARRRAIDRVIENCRLGEVIHRRAESYSGGLKRRLNLAIGLLNEPQILYLDEPTVGIDAQSRNFILEVIRSLKAAGVTVVYTSHYMEEVQALCDEIAIIDHGRLVLQSRVADLLRDEGRVLDLRLHTEPAVFQLEKIAALGQYQVRGKHLKLSLAKQHGLLEVAQLLEALELPVAQINYGINRLEDIYLSITQYELRD